MYAGEDGESHFETLSSLPLNATHGDTHNLASLPFPTKEAFFHVYTHQYFEDWHVETHRLAVLFLEGEQELETKHGKRRFSRGDLLIAEDMTGRGHQSRGIKSGCSLVLILGNDALDYQK
jgi:hypothetical protein